MKEKKISIGGLVLNYKIAGSGPALLILHGWGGSSDSWIKVQENLAKENLTVIVPDFPGFGESLTPPNPWGTVEYADFILKFINELKLDNFFLLGHSFGGRIAIKLFDFCPEKIKKLILCNSAGLKPKPSLKDKTIFLVAKIGNAIFTPGPLARLRDGARNMFYIFLRHRDYVKANGTMKETLKKVLGDDFLENLNSIKCPTLIIWGENDKLIPVEYSFLFKEKIENSQLKIFPRTGHSPHLEKPKKLSQAILDFLF